MAAIYPGLRPSVAASDLPLTGISMAGESRPLSSTIFTPTRRSGGRSAPAYAVKASDDQAKARKGNKVVTLPDSAWSPNKMKIRHCKGEEAMENRAGRDQPRGFQRLCLSGQWIGQQPESSDSKLFPGDSTTNHLQLCRGA